MRRPSRRTVDHITAAIRLSTLALLGGAIVSSACGRDPAPRADSSAAAPAPAAVAPPRALVAAVAAPARCVVTSTALGDRGTWRNDSAGIQPMKYGTSTKLGAACDTIRVVKVRPAPPPPPPAVAVTVTTEVGTMPAGTTQRATARVTRGGAVDSSAVPQWSFGPAAVCAAQDATTLPGRLRALAAGTCTVTARDAASGTTGTRAVQVTAAPAPTPPPVDPAPAPDTSPPPPPPAGAVGVAELPRRFLDTRVAATPVTGTSIRVAAGQSLQAALDRAQPGDEVVLDAGATFVGNFVLRNKTTGTGWITIRSATAAGTMPPEGTRMTPARARAAGLATLLTATNEPVLATAPGAHHVRVVGLELGATPAVTYSYSLVNLGTADPAQNSLAVTPHDLILDRVYLHGHAALDLARCVALHSAATAVVDSYVSECHARGRDSQAVWGSNGPGPFKIAGNYLEGAGEVVLFGGDDSRAAELLSADIEVRRNHITRPTSWKGVWQVKNLFELKQGRRVLVEGNVLENHWADAQDGFAVVLKSVSQYGSAPWTTTQDVTFRSNVLRNIAGGFNLHPKPEPTPAIPAARVTIANNLAYNVNVGPFTGHGRMYQVLQDFAGVTIAHNTAVISDAAGMLVSLAELPQAPGFRFVDNVGTHGAYGLFGGGQGEGSAALRTYLAADAVLAGNAFIAYPAWQYATIAAANRWPASLSAAGFVDAAGGDYRLAAGSPLKGTATDGRDPGVDVAELEAHVAGVVQP